MCRPNLMVYALPLTPNLAIPHFHALCWAVLCVWRYTRANLVRTATNRPTTTKENENESSPLTIYYFSTMKNIFKSILSKH